MCGIVGIFSFAGAPPYREFWGDLVNHLYHRGPDEGAWWSDGPYFFGHRRLAIIDLTSGGQPMATPDGNLVVTFNGEIYNYLELRAELEARGYRFQTSSDTEALLHGYAAWGYDLPKHLTGMFAFALADRRQGTLYLARDRFGEKPLYLYRSPHYLAFASELRPLTALPDLPRQLDADALGGYLSLNYVPGNATLLESIRKLPPASWMLIATDGHERSEVYWEPPTQALPSNRQSFADSVEDLAQRLDRSVALCLRSDVPVGIFLSGGMDSSLVAEAAARQGKLSQAYFIDFEQKSYSEYEAARFVANRLSLPLERTILTPQALEDFLGLVAHADDPLADSSSLAVWTISRAAAQKNKVVLGGDGGDEIFGGYLTYRASGIHRRWLSPLPGFLKRGMAQMGRRLPVSEAKVTFSYKLRRFLRATDLSTAQAHFTWNGTWLADDAAHLVAEGKTRQTVAGSMDRLIRRIGLRGDTVLDLQRADVGEYLSNDILTKVDRMSMAHGLETRAPLLNHELAEWALSQPEAYKIRHGESKALLRALARKIYGPAIADRPKQGFSIPIHTWTRGPLRELIGDLLSPDAIARLGVMDEWAVSKVLNDHFSGKQAYGFEVWGLAVLSAWYRLRVANPPPKPEAAILHERRFCSMV